MLPFNHAVGNFWVVPIYLAGICSTPARYLTPETLVLVFKRKKKM